MKQPSPVAAGDPSRVGCLALFLVAVDELRQLSPRDRRRAAAHLLADLARCLPARVDDAAPMARRSGEEFLALRRVRDADAADRIAAQIRNRLAARRFLCGGQEVRLTVHVGGVVAVGPAAAPLGDAVPALLQVAERVLREARAARSHVRIARFLANQHGTWVGKRVVPSVLRDHGTHRRVQDGKRADTPPRPYGRLLRRSWFDR